MLSCKATGRSQGRKLDLPRCGKPRVHSRTLGIAEWEVRYLSVREQDCSTILLPTLLRKAEHHLPTMQDGRSGICGYLHMPLDIYYSQTWRIMW